MTLLSSAANAGAMPSVTRPMIPTTHKASVFMIPLLAEPWGKKHAPGVVWNYAMLRRQEPGWPENPVNLTRPKSAAEPKRAIDP